MLQETLRLVFFTTGADKDFIMDNLLSQWNRKNKFSLSQQLGLQVKRTCEPKVASSLCKKARYLVPHFLCKLVHKE